MNLGHDQILILDFGSQTTQLIARRIRELGVYCEIWPCTHAPPPALPPRLRGLVLSGGPSSVDHAEAPPFDPAWLQLGVPVLGICYGMQLLAHLLGGEVQRADHREFGPATVEVLAPQGIFKHTQPATRVWMSHGDQVARVPEGWDTLARTASCPVASMRSPDGRMMGVQFHPEVTHTVEGADMLRSFALEVCGAVADWSMSGFISEQSAKIRAQVGDRHVICAMSGGVDSAVTAALLHRAIGHQLHCVFVDNGVLRANEAASVAEEFTELDLVVVDARALFLSRLQGVTEPEAKRKIIGEAFIEVFEVEAKRLAAAHGSIDFLAQGTLYPDVIESVSFRGPSATIKSHHNVGGLPERMRMALIEPMRELFKDEVRALGTVLGMSPKRVYRQPFPGPGLAVRVLGEVTAARVALLQRADAIVEQEVEAAGLTRSLWQSFAVLLPVKSVGVMGDARTYEETCALRAVHSTDGMTAQVAHLPWDVLERISTRIINEVRGINRVVYDISNKPPATIEWE